MASGIYGPPRQGIGDPCGHSASRRASPPRGGPRRDGPAPSRAGWCPDERTCSTHATTENQSAAADGRAAAGPRRVAAALIWAAGRGPVRARGRRGRRAAGPPACGDRHLLARPGRRRAALSGVGQLLRPPGRHQRPAAAGGPFRPGRDDRPGGSRQRAGLGHGEGLRCDVRGVGRLGPARRRAGPGPAGHAAGLAASGRAARPEAVAVGQGGTRRRPATPAPASRPGRAPSPRGPAWSRRPGSRWSPSVSWPRWRCRRCWPAGRS